MDTLNIIKNIKLQLLNNINDPHIEQILKIRNENEIRNNMLNNSIITLNDHKKWFKDQIIRKKKKFFKILFLESLIGIITINFHDDNFNSWAFYLSSKSKKGLGALVEYLFLNKYFFELGYKELNCEVLSFNTSVLKMHKKFGFREIDKKFKVLKRFNKEQDLILLKIDSDIWKLNRDIIKNKLRLSI